MPNLQTPPRRMSSRMPPRSEKHDNFRRLAPKRTESALDAIRKISNLSSANYEFEDAEVAKIFDTLEEAITEARGMFARNLKNRGRFTL